MDSGGKHDFLKGPQAAGTMLNWLLFEYLIRILLVPAVEEREKSAKQ